MLNKVRSHKLVQDNPWTKCSTHYYCGPHEGQVEEFYKCNAAIPMWDVFVHVCVIDSLMINILKISILLLQAYTIA